MEMEDYKDDTVFINDLKYQIKEWIKNSDFINR